MVSSDELLKTKTDSLRQLVEKSPANLNYLLSAIDLLVYENELLRKIASRYSHDLRSPVTNIDMLLQLYERAGGEADREVYIGKMIKSIKRLQEGFEELSAERKGLLVKQSDINSIFLDNVVKELKQKLPKNIALDVDFTEGKRVNCNHSILIESLLLLFEPFGEAPDRYTIQLFTEKHWSGAMLTIVYPEYIDFENHNRSENDITKKNLEPYAHVLGWNYYFAVLFLRTVGATASIVGEKNKNSIIQITFKH